jgi:hypothetical protein
MAATTPVVVFVSSTWLDMQPERGAVRDLTLRMNGLKFLGMEHFGARDETTTQVSLNEVERGDLYVGVIGGRYGSGITELEYECARDKGIPCFIYLKRDSAIRESDEDPVARGKLSAFGQRLRRAHTCVEFDTPEELAFKLSADLHNWLFEQHMSRGLARLSIDFLSRVQGFVAEYIGTLDRPVPFGGRGAELAQLNEWLADPTAPPYLLLTAAAGRGKSALLVRWTQALVASDAVVPLFFPVSIRFRTNLANVIFASLTAYLASLHGEQLSVNPDTPPEIWRGRLSDLLLRPLPDGRRLLLVLDGLDEAADWEAGPDLFPPHIGPHARVVVSARLLAGDTDASAWLRRLGWDNPGRARSLALEGLSESGLSEALDHMGVPLTGLSARTEIVHELHRLSEGEPLLVRLYVDDLFDRAPGAVAVSVKELRAIKPGLPGFFARWWDDQRRLWGAAQPLREKRVQVVMDLLANALGPLQREDLLALARHSVALDSWTLDEALEPLRRFIVGDGVDHGYVYSHPRLGIHMRERLSRPERQNLEERFVAWCETCVGEAGRASAPPLPAYVVLYFGAHLDRQQADAARYRPMLDDVWRRGWLELEGTYSGYRADLQRIQKALRREPTSSPGQRPDGVTLMLVLRCALCTASVDQIARSTPVELIAPLVQHKIWGRNGALRYARSIADPLRRAEALVYLARTESEPTTSLVLHEVLETLALVPAVDEGDAAKAAMLGGLAPELPQSVLRAALDLALGISRRSCMAQAVEALLPRLSAPQLKQVLRVTRGLADADLRLRLLLELARAHPTVAVAHAADESLSPWERSWMLLDASNGLSDAPREAALAVVRAVIDAALADAFAPPDIADLVLLVALADRLDESIRRALLMRSFPLLCRAPNSALKARLLGGLSEHVPSPMREQAIAEGLRGLMHLRSPDSQAAGLQALAPYLAEVEAAQAFGWVYAIEDDNARGRALAALVPRLTEPLRSQAVAQLLAIQDPAAVLEAVVPVVSWLDPAALDQLVELMFMDDHVLPDTQYRCLSALRPYLSTSAIECLVTDGHSSESSPTELAHPASTLSRQAALATGLPGHLRGASARQVFRALYDEFGWTRFGATFDILQAWAAATDDASIDLVASAVVDHCERHSYWAQALALLAPRMSIAVLEKAVLFLHGDRPGLSAMAPRLAKTALEKVALALQQIGDDEAASLLLGSCFRRLPAQLVRGRWGADWSRIHPDIRGAVMVHWWILGGDRSAGFRGEVVNALLHMQQDVACARAIEQFLDVTGETSSPDEMVALMTRLAQLSSKEGLNVAAAASIKNAVAALAGSVSDALLVEHFAAFFDASLNVSEEGMALTASLCDRVAPELVRTAFDVARARMASSLPRADPMAYPKYPRWPGMLALLGVAQRLGEPGLRAAVSESLGATVRAAPRSARKALVLDLCERLDSLVDPLSDTALSLIREMNDPWGRLRAAISVLPHLDDARLSSVIEEVLALITAVPEAERQTVVTAFPDGPAQKAAQAGTWRTAVMMCVGSRLTSEGVLPFATAVMDEIHGLGADPAAAASASVLLPVMPASMRPVLAQAVFAGLRYDHGPVDGKVAVLLPALPYLDRPALRDVLAQTLRYVRHKAVQGVDEGLAILTPGYHYDLERGLLTAMLPRLTPKQCVQLWRQTLRTGVKRYSQVFCDHISSLALAREGVWVLQAMVDASRWDALTAWASARAAMPEEVVVAEVASTRSPRLIALTSAALASCRPAQETAAWRMRAVEALDTPSVLLEIRDAVGCADWPELPPLAPAQSSDVESPSSPPSAPLPGEAAETRWSSEELFFAAATSRAQLMETVSREIAEHPEAVAVDLIESVVETVLEVRRWWP